MKFTSREAHALLEGRPLKLDEDSVREILGRLANNEPQDQIAQRYNVVRPYISMIKHGHRWTSVVRPFWQARGAWPKKGARKRHAALLATGGAEPAG